MPRYEYVCSNGHVTEMRAGYDVIALACPMCGRVADRVSVYRDQQIRGETVAKGHTNASLAGDIKNKHGRYRVGLWQEAQQEAHHARQKKIGASGTGDERWRTRP